MSTRNYIRIMEIMTLSRSDLADIERVLNRMFPGTQVEEEYDASYMNPMLIIYYPADTHRVSLTGTEQALARSIAASADRYEKFIAIVEHAELHTDVGSGYDE